MPKKQPVHKTNSLCRNECGPSAPGGTSLGSVLPQKGSNTAPKGEKHPGQGHAAATGPMKAGGGSTEQ